MKTQNQFFKTCSLRIKKRKGYVLVLDEGTTGVKAFVFDGEGGVVSKAYQKIHKFRPRKDWVEQDSIEILRSSIKVMREAIKTSGASLKEIRGFGITNQREATVMWDIKTGKPVYKIIGWEDRRTKSFCDSLRKKHGERIREMTGLVADSYFSASKIRWVLKNVKSARVLASQNRLAFGTVDTWLLWNLCEGNPHVTDETNASRTLLFNIKTRRWDENLLGLFDVPQDLLPLVEPSRSDFGILSENVIGARIPVFAVCGDQQSSMYAASRAIGCGTPVTKVTYGTGSFVMQQIEGFELHDGFFTTLVPGTKNSVFAFEAKVEGSGEGVTKTLEDHERLVKYLARLAQKVGEKIASLPSKPKIIVADGGAARDGIIVEMQEKISKTHVCLQQTFDGTALGTALLVWDKIKD